MEIQLCSFSTFSFPGWSGSLGVFSSLIRTPPWRSVLRWGSECWKAVGQIYLHGTRLGERVEQGETLPHFTEQRRE